MSAPVRVPLGEGASPSARWCLCNSRDLQRYSFNQKLPCGWKSHGAASRDICVGVPPVKIVWTPRRISGKVCRQTATVDRNVIDIRGLEDVAIVTRNDVLEAR